MRRTTMLVVCSLALAFCAGSAFAAVTAPPADTLKVDYFANANTASAPDGTVRITNPGTSGGNLCANIFVFDVDQEMSECCSCLQTTDGLDTLSINTDLTKNPLTGSVLNTGAIKIVSAKLVNGACPTPTATNATPALRAWVTHIQSASSITETAATDATFSINELYRLNAECNAIVLDGSGHGVCTCGTGE